MQVFNRMIYSSSIGVTSLGELLQFLELFFRCWADRGIAESSLVSSVRSPD